MNCHNCGLPTEEGARYCGNCGQSLHKSSRPFLGGPSADVYGRTLAPIAVAGAQGVPAYAFAHPGQHAGEIKAVLAISCAVIGAIGSIFMPLIGVMLGIAAIVLGTMSRRSHTRLASTSGIVIGVIATLASIGIWSYLIVQTNHTKTARAEGQTATAAAASNSAITPCYQVGFVKELNVATVDNSCDMQAYDGPTINNSTDAYKVYGYHQTTITAANFAGFAKQAIEKDINDNLPGFAIDGAGVGQFAGSQSYVVYASKPDKSVTYVEAAVLHGGTKDNIFVFVHASNQKTTDLHGLEAQWQWK